MDFDRIKSNYIIPADAEILSVDMGLCAHTHNSDDYIGTFGLGPCTAIAASIITDNGDVYRFCSHIDMGEIRGYSIVQHITKFKSFLTQITDNFQSTDIRLVSSQSFLYPDSLDEKETKLLSVLKDVREKYGFDITHSCSTVVQISPEGIIKTPSEREIEYNKMQQKREVAKANGYSFDYSTKTPCIVDKNLGCYLSNCSSSLQLKLRNCNQEMQRQIIEEELEGSFWESLMQLGGVVSVGDSPLNPGQMAWFLENFKEVAQQNYGHIMMCAEKIGEPVSESSLFKHFDFY